MLNISSLKFLSQPAVGATLLTAAYLFVPLASVAQGQQGFPNPQVIPPANRPAPPATAVDTKYLLGGGDLIRVNVFEVSEYGGEYQIPPGGAINLPLIGSVTVQGLTTEQAADVITQRYRRFLKRPQISVNLLSPRPINILVAGEVTRPGAYTLNLQGGAGQNPGVQYPTVLAALTVAQGVTLAADVSQVQLKRKTSGSTEQVVNLNLKELIQTGSSSQDITLRDGDVIVVPTATNFNVAEARNLFAANFAASQTAPRTVAVIGQVNRPGSYLVTAGGSTEAQTPGGGGTPVASGTGLPTVTRAIQLAGGITSEADVTNIKLRRPTRTGGEQTIELNLLELLRSGDVNQDVIVQDGDTIVISKATEVNPAIATELATTTLSPDRIQVGVVGEVKRPGAVDIRPNSSLNQALLAAGGFNDARARSGSVELIRLNPNGTVTKREIKVDFNQGINEQTNPIVRNNDIVVVGRSGLARTSDSASLISGPLGTFLGVVRFIFGF
ncbi:MAG TPA: SLBB domain-containing protein [Leptolyngbyaceae cyanobacterium]